MAFVEDTFWERHPPVDMNADAIESPGLRLYEVVDAKTYATYAIGMLVGLPCVAVMGSVSIDLVFLALWVLFFVAAPFDNLFQRYRLYQDERDTPEFDGHPARLRALLWRIVNSNRLMEHLGPPSPPPSPLVPNAFPQLMVATHPSVTVVAGLALALHVPAINAIVPIDSIGLPYPHLSMAMVVFVVTQILIWKLRCRVLTGYNLLGTGAMDHDDIGATARWDEVQAAALQWDTLLGKPYLLLELHGKPQRYYSPMQDPLHLLRVAKYRMPHLKLQA